MFTSQPWTFIETDSTLSSSSNWKTISSLNQSLSHDRAEIEVTKLYINTQKTKALLVTEKRLRRRMDQDTAMLDVVTDTAEIEQVASHKLLGLIIDEDLTYEVHIDNLCNKLSKRLGLFRHIGPCLKKNQRIIYFNNAVIKLLMMYASSVWTSCNKMLLERVLRLQKWAARIIVV